MGAGSGVGSGAGAGAGVGVGAGAGVGAGDDERDKGSVDRDGFIRRGVGLGRARVRFSLGGSPEGLRVLGFLRGGDASSFVFRLSTRDFFIVSTAGTTTSTRFFCLSRGRVGDVRLLPSDLCAFCCSS